MGIEITGNTSSLVSIRRSSFPVERGGSFPINTGGTHMRRPTRVTQEPRSHELRRSQVIWQASRKENAPHNLNIFPNRTDQPGKSRHEIWQRPEKSPLKRPSVQLATARERLTTFQKKEFAADMNQAKLVMQKLLSLGIGKEEAKQRTLLALQVTMTKRSYGRSLISNAEPEIERDQRVLSDETKQSDYQKAKNQSENNKFLQKLRTKEKIKTDISVKKILKPIASAMQDYMRVMDEEDKKKRDELEKQLLAEKLQQQQNVAYAQDEKVNERRLLSIRQALARISQQQEGTTIKGSDVAALLPQNAPVDLKSDILQHSSAQDGSYQDVLISLSHMSADTPDAFMGQAENAVLKAPAVTVNNIGTEVTTANVKRVLAVKG